MVVFVTIIVYYLLRRLLVLNIGENSEAFQSLLLGLILLPPKRHDREAIVLDLRLVDLLSSVRLEHGEFSVLVAYDDVLPVFLKS